MRQITRGALFNAETEAAATFVVLNSGLELYADLIAREREGGLLGNKLQPTKDDELGGDLTLLLPDRGTKEFSEVVWLIAYFSFVQGFI